MRHTRLVVDKRGKTYLRLERRLDPIDVEVADEHEGQQLLGAMGLDPLHSLAQYSMSNGTWRGFVLRACVSLIAVVVLLLGLAALVGAPWSMALLLASVVLPVCLAPQQLRVVVGADGVQTARPFARPVFMRFSEIGAVETDDTNVALHLRDGRTLKMHFQIGGRWGTTFYGEDGRPDDARALVERIRAGLDEVARHTGSEAIHLARGLRRTREWAAEAAATADGRASYRSAALPREVLWSTVANPLAAPGARAGAAIALRAALDSTDRARLERIADGVAAPNLKMAIRVAASRASEVELIEALERFEEDELREGR